MSTGEISNTTNTKNTDNKIFVFSDRNKNYLIFSKILKFAKFVFGVYHESPLYAYINHMEQADIFEGTNVFVESFKDCLNGKHRAKYGDKAYFNVPKALDRKDRYSIKIKEMFQNIKSLYDDIYQSEESKMIEGFYEKFSNGCQQNFESEPNLISDDGKIKESTIQNICGSLTPDITSTFSELSNKHMLCDVIKLMLIDVYDRKSFLGDDYEPIQRIIRIIGNSIKNTDIEDDEKLVIANAFTSNQKEIIKEVRNLKDFTKLVSMFSGMGLGNIGGIMGTIM
ncbi:hypothetical protein [Dasineura jujubifolia toursvirus 2a]|nr:hypothetical protein [Dasineura jujubifolia toursvirus 2a]